MNTFEKTLKYLSITGNIDSDNQPILEPVEKQVSFYKLSQTDARQARLFFMMRPLYKSVKVIGESENQIIADPNIMFDLTLQAIDILLIVDPDGSKTGNKFTELDKKEFLNDSFAVLSFGEWFLTDSAPFFLKYFANYLKSQTIPKE
jgi:hypothetical protein